MMIPSFFHSDETHGLSPHAIDKPSAWVSRFASLIPLGGEVLDLACGSGRHVRFLTAMGYSVLAVDRSAEALAASAGAGVSTLQIDLESSVDEHSAWTFAGNRFAGIVVTNYLHRPLFADIFRSLAHNGILIYETFAHGNERFGKPSNPDFLLMPGELLKVVQATPEHPLRIIAYEDGYVDLPKPAMVQRICVLKGGSPIPPDRLRLI